MIVIDDFSRFTVTYFLQHKSEALDKFMQYVEYSQRHAGRKLKVLRSHNGGEFTSVKFHKCCQSLGIAQPIDGAICLQSEPISRVEKPVSARVRESNVFSVKPVQKVLGRGCPYSILYSELTSNFVISRDNAV